MANILQEQYCSVFSDPDSKNIVMDHKGLPQGNEKCLADIEFSSEDIVDAIDELDSFAATADEDIPASILKGCKEALSIPLTMLWKWSMTNGIVPPSLKEQFITPVYKKGDKTDPENYRPISLTSHVIKVFERVVRKRMVVHLEANNLISDTQHGFRKGRSCLTQLLQHYDEILSNLVKGYETDVLYLDYAKAFDKVDHNILLYKLKFYGIDGQLYEWIKSFFTNRTQRVVIDGHHSVPKHVISGVPQGSVFGPILFIPLL